MPINAKAQKVLNSLKEEYGKKEGEKVFYALANKLKRVPETWEKKASDKKSKAVVIKGNPNRKSDDLEEGTLYPMLQKLLEERGYEVSYDPGEPYTVPDESAAVWIGHSRGADRLRFAPNNVIAIPIGSRLQASINNPDDVVDLDNPDDYDKLPTKNRQAHNDWHPSMKEKLLAALDKKYSKT